MIARLRWTPLCKVYLDILILWVYIQIFILVQIFYQLVYLDIIYFNTYICAYYQLLFLTDVWVRDRFIIFLIAFQIGGFCLLLVCSRSGGLRG